MTDETSPLPPVEGRLDGVSGDRIVGWAWRPDRPELQAFVELFTNDGVIAATSAGVFRPDLAAAGKRNGACAFEFYGLANLPRAVALHARVNIDGELHALRGAPVILPADDAPAPPPPSPDEPLSSNVMIPLAGPGDLTGYLDWFGPETIKGWVMRRGQIGRPVRLTLHDSGERIATIDANVWRPDLAEHRQGDGRCGVDAPLPLSLRDGQSHRVDIRDAETNVSILAQPLVVRFDPPLQATPAPKAAAKGPPAGSAPLFTFIVNFYNMKREATRTLTSLSRAYQRDIDDIAYEVLCIDNGSRPPLERDWVESFGPEFRLFTPSKILPSPCAAINEAARAAKGRNVVIMIDGAHVLTPGVLREAADAFRESPDGIVAVRQWWVGGDQRWLSSIAYTREMEDILFDRIAWPSDGYELFRVGVPIFESPNSWFDGMAESNCAFIPRDLYLSLGGIDEAFDEPGAGFANLDLYRRVCDAVGDKIAVLIGEASFHQFHDGTTTNVTDEEKDRRVQVYAERYRTIRGKEFEPVSHDRFYLRGRLRSVAMLTARQRPWFTGELGITDRVRPANPEQHFDTGARINIQGSYAECGLDQNTTWLGQSVRLAPADLINIHAVLNDIRPSAIVTTTRDDGLIAFLDSVLNAMGLAKTTIIRVLKAPPQAASPQRVDVIVGDPYAAATLGAIERAIGGAKDTVVLFAPQDDDYLPIDPLRAYANFVTPRSYLIFLGAVLGQPWLGYSRYWFAAAIRSFLNHRADFAVDKKPDMQIACMCAGGFLKRG